MKTSIIYEPKGPALEYCALGANLYSGCTHRCRYCYAPRILRKTIEDFQASSTPRANVLHKFTRDCQRLSGDNRPVHMSFTCDPYPEGGSMLTRAALYVMHEHGIRVQLLTKAGVRAVRDFDIMKEMDAWFGVTLCFQDESLREEWEPGASSIRERISSLTLAKSQGIRTWVSIEPVVDAEEALAVIAQTMSVVDHYKIGKLNARDFETKKIEAAIDWPRFRADVLDLLWGHSHYIKKALLEAV